MPTSCVVIFEGKSTNVAYSGTTLRGNVMLTVTNAKSVRGIYIKIKREGIVRWSEGVGKYVITHSGSETYIEERFYLIGGPSGKTVVTVKY